MKIHLLVASDDNDYTEHLSNVFGINYSDVFELSIASSVQSLKEQLDRRQADLAL